MSIVTLTTDLGYRDPYLAIVKARLLSLQPQPAIVDLSCDIKDNNLSDAAFILKNSLPYFPKETIHLVAVKFISGNSGLHKTNEIDNTRYLLSKHNDQFIICPDNGLFTLLDSKFDSPVYQLYYDGAAQHHFFLKDIFITIAENILNKKPIQEFAIPTKDYYKAIQFESYVNNNSLVGKGIYIDDFGNIITNITREQFTNVIGKKAFSITLPGTRLHTLHTTYDEVKHGQALILFNSFGYLEVAINGGNAQKMLCPRDIGSKFDFNISIDFND